MKFTRRGFLGALVAAPVIGAVGTKLGMPAMPAAAPDLLVAGHKMVDPPLCTYPGGITTVEQYRDEFIAAFEKAEHLLEPTPIAENVDLRALVAKDYEAAGV